jgi:hypothetical protein
MIGGLRLRVGGWRCLVLCYIKQKQKKIKLKPDIPAIQPFYPRSRSPNIHIHTTHTQNKNNEKAKQSKIKIPIDRWHVTRKKIRARASTLAIAILLSSHCFAVRVAIVHTTPTPARPRVPSQLKLSNQLPY